MNSNDIFGPIYQIEIDTNNIIKKWNNVIDIEIELGFSRKYIKECINSSRLHTTYGFLWVLSEDYDKLSDQEKKDLIKTIHYNKNCKSIRKINIETGEVIQVWSSISEAVKDCPEYTIGGISNVILGKSKTYKGFFWELVNNNDKERTIHKNTDLKIKPIYQIDKFTKDIVKEWDGVENIINNNNNYSYFSISRCLHNTTSTYKGYFWIYKNEYKKLKDSINFFKITIGRPHRNILQLDPTTLKIIKDWSSYKLKDIVTIFGKGIKNSEIITCCGYPNNGKSQKTAKGYVWQYKEVFENLTEKEKEKT